MNEGYISQVSTIAWGTHIDIYLYFFQSILISSYVCMYISSYIFFISLLECFHWSSCQCNIKEFSQYGDGYLVAVDVSKRKQQNTAFAMVSYFHFGKFISVTIVRWGEECIVKNRNKKWNICICMIFNIQDLV